MVVGNGGSGSATPATDAMMMKLYHDSDELYEYNNGTTQAGVAIQESRTSERR